jgi:trimethylamine---corrinoid protein Co-methyltransferase
MDLIKALSENQIEQIRTETENLLETVGFRVQHKEILEQCRAAGAKVDDSGIVRLPKKLLRELLAKVPSSYKARGVTGKEWTVGDGQGYSQAIVTDPWIIDYETQKPRRPRLDDLRRHTIILQKLDHVGGTSRMDFPVTDVPEPTSSLRALEEHLNCHDKHYHVYVASWESFLQWLELGEILAGGKGLANRGLFTVAVAIVSPLTISGLNCDLLKYSCDYQFTIVPTICPMAGSTSPYTMASTLLLGNAENVFTAVLAQIIKPGTPFVYCFGPSVTNLKTTHDMYYTLDKMLWKFASIQLAKSYNLPCIAECGGTMTYRYDQQSGAEGMLFMLAARNSKANILAGFGSCYNACGMSAEMMVIHDAWFQAAKFLDNGINLDSMHLGFENLRQAGPGGNFLTDDLTLEFMRGGEFFNHELFDFSGQAEGKSLLTRAHEKVEAMVADFKSPVPEKIRENLKRFFHDEYKKMGIV